MGGISWGQKTLNPIIQLSADCFVKLTIFGGWGWGGRGRMAKGGIRYIQACKWEGVSWYWSIVLNNFKHS